MKRLRKLIHVTLIWTSICLMSADPAAACRLLANRRCCCSCSCPATPPPCDEKSPPQMPATETPAPEASPSDQPRTTSTTNATRPTNTTSTPDLPSGLPVTLSPVSPTLPLTPTTNVIREPSPARSSTAPIGGTIAMPDSQPRATTGAIEIGRANADNLNTPTASAASPSTEYLRRQPADVGPPAATAVNPPAATLPSAPSGDPFAPQPLTPDLTQRQSFAAPPVAPPTATSPDREPHVSASEPTHRAPVSNNAASLATRDESSPQTTDKPLAAPAVAQPARPVATPEFPPVSDDPFAPLVSPSPVPAKTEDHADDPFAPLPSKEQPAAPLVVEPTLKKSDLLAPGADGRLPLRQWTDNSGTFNVKAKLVLILDGKVRLLKETGRTTTVAITRLSQADQTYIADAIERYGEGLVKLPQFASR